MKIRKGEKKEHREKIYCRERNQEIKTEGDNIEGKRREKVRLEKRRGSGNAEKQSTKKGRHAKVSNTAVQQIICEDMSIIQT